jgi:hypothetical protein
MTRIRIFVLALLIGGALVCGFLLDSVVNRGRRPRPRVFIGHKAFYMGKEYSSPEYERAKDVWESCPSIELMFDESQTDYGLWMNWQKDHWNTTLLRTDSAFLLQEDSPDFNQIVRHACKAIHKDEEWPVPEKKSEEKKSEANRYELHDLHNGPISTSAIIDKKSGKVWVWTTLTDNRGKQTGKSYFASEEVSPEPEE